MTLNTDEILGKLLANSLPGEEAHIQLLPKWRSISNVGGKYQNAAVLVLIFTIEQAKKIVLIKRTPDKGPHSGQISFPGGKAEIFDKDIMATAVREFKEETGCNTDDLAIIGQLSKLYIDVSNFMVHPFVGIYKGTPVFKPDSFEVEKIIIADLKKLLDTTIKDQTIEIRGQMLKVPCIRYDNEIIWGATAMILNELLLILRKSNFLI